MKFHQWLNTLDLANLNDLQPQDGMEMGWFACKEEMLKILDNPKSWEFVDNDNQTLTEKALKSLRNL